MRKDLPLVVKINRNGHVEFGRGESMKVSLTVEELQSLITQAPALIDRCNTVKSILNNS